MAARGADLGHRLLQLGTVLFLLGLLVGLAVPQLANPRMALASHLEGVMNGIFLLVLGLLWPRLALGQRAARATFGLATYAAFANWGTTLLAAAWGAGARMSFAAGKHRGSEVQEVIVDALLVSLSLAIVAVCILLLWGLRLTPRAR